METPLIYEIWEPEHIKPGRTYPALFVMHGIGSNEKNMLSLVDGLENFYIFSIRGPLSHGKGFAYFTIQEYGKPHRDVFDEGVSKLTGFIDYAGHQYPLDPNRLYLLGFSQGAILAMTLGLTLGNRIRGIIALSGYIPHFVKEEYNLKSVDQLSLFISHGELDQVLPYEWGVENNEFFKKLGASVTFRTYKEGHIVSSKNKEDFVRWILDNAREVSSE
ncbi:esterase [Siminovitchia acidinfaciens]|uniref:Esterase n=1 Tax=Siminovitchia acidinfaciens TaxID=2321395 RepID=A0A429XUK3_9BACI|nr:esterase [Siminovitchia acidinfaciens]RST71823.1 esterase [Siminovitchia acidinfaciens]